MKALFVINGLGTGGAERSLSELLAHAAIDPMVVCLHHRSEGVEDTTIADGVPVRFLRSRGAVGRARELRSIVRATAPDLVHTTIFEADLAGRLACAGTQVPVLTSLVNTSYDAARFRDPAVASWRLHATRVADGWTGRHLTSHFHAITHAVKDAAVLALGLDARRITVVERGRDPERLGRASPERSAAARERLGIDAEVPVIVTAGRQEYQKAQWHLVDAMAKVWASHPTAQLVIAGRRGNASLRLERTIEATGMSDAVRLLGHRNDLPEVLTAGDVFVLPSLFEGLGGVLIEAMALEMPIVASDLPATREVLEPGGNADLVTPGSSADLADAMVALLDDRARMRAYGSRGRDIFEERFTLQRSLDRMVALFERVASEGRERIDAS